jgi:Cft2 family RNA processing exonuclease
MRLPIILRKPEQGMKSKGGAGEGWEVEARERGIYLPQVDLWMDPQRPQKRAVVTHAHYDHLAGHDEILASPATARLLRVRVPKRTKIREIPFGKAIALGKSASLTLLHAGHILGSAMVWVKRKVGSRETRLLYTGDFKLRGGTTAESCQPKQADVLVMETTFGRPAYRFPPEDKVVGEIVSFCRSALKEGKVPILLGYSLGKSQEILHRIGSAGFPILIHAAGHRMCEVYRELGQSLPPAGKLGKINEEKVRGHVLIVPPSVARGKEVKALESRKLAVVTGWALDRGVIYRYGCDEAFALSDHADYGELIEMVERVKPKEVRTVHGFSKEFAMDLQEKGYRAWALEGETQMVLPLGFDGGKTKRKMGRGAKTSC